MGADNEPLAGLGSFHILLSIGLHQIETFPGFKYKRGHLSDYNGNVSLMVVRTSIISFCMITLQRLDVILQVEKIALDFHLHREKI